MNKKLNKTKINNELVTHESSEITVPTELNEIFVQVILQQKPLLAIYMLKCLQYRSMLCFVNSKETAKRLNKLFELNGIKSMEYSSALHAARRKRIQTKFEQDKLDVLVCSDVMARGMDLTNVGYVLLYDAPRHLSSYIHKVGRTARAGRSGTAITFLEHKQVYFFKKMTESIQDQSQSMSKNKEQDAQSLNKHKVKEVKIPKSKFKPVLDDYRQSLEKLKEELSSANKKNSLRNSNNKKDSNKNHRISSKKMTTNRVSNNKKDLNLNSEGNDENLKEND